MHTLWTITATHIATVRNISYGSARKEWKHIKQLLEVDVLKLRDLAAYYGLDAKELASMLYNTRSK